MDLVATTFSLPAVVYDALRALAPRAHGKGLELLADVAPDVPANVVGDPVRLRQVIVNLVDNAIKFASRGEIVVVVDIAEDGRVRFAVRDSGIGIAPDEQALLVGTFEQADQSLARRHGGTGLGLTIATHLVGVMGGTLAVASEPGRGSTFTFALELAGPGGDRGGAVAAAVDRGSGEAVRSAAGAAGRSQPRFTRLSILVAEDNELNVDLMRQLLGKRGHDVSIAVDGREALARHESSGFDVLLLDIHLPLMDGCAVVREIRRRERAGGRHLHVIATTAVGRREDREACFAAGVDDFLSKPISSASLWRALGRVVPEDRPGASLIDAAVLLAACDGDESILQTIVLALQSSLPERVRAVEAAFEARDLGQVSRAAQAGRSALLLLHRRRAGGAGAGGARRARRARR